MAFVCGIAGVGKSALLRAFAADAQAAGATVLAVEGESTEPTEAGFLRALSGALGTDVESPAAATAALAARRGRVLDKPLQLPLEPRAEMSDSMAPELRAGDLLFLKHRQADEVSVGDIVAFSDPEGTGNTIIHRAVQITPASNGELEFVTRGDANGTSVERWRINRDGTVGVVAFDLPLLGRAAIWLQDLGGRTLLLLASVLFMGLALVRIWRPDRSEPQA